MRRARDELPAFADFVGEVFTNAVRFGTVSSPWEVL